MTNRHYTLHCTVLFLNLFKLSKKKEKQKIDKSKVQNRIEYSAAGAGASLL